MSQTILFNQLRNGQFKECLRLINSEDIDYHIIHSSIKQNYFYFFCLGLKPALWRLGDFKDTSLLLAQRLIEKDVNYHFKDKNGNNLLMILIKKHINHLSNFFMDKIDLDDTNYEGEDILTIAIKAGNAAIISTLNQQGYEIRPHHISIAFNLSNGMVAQELLKSSYRFSAIDLLFFKDLKKHYRFHETIVEHYKKRGYSFFIQDDWGNTPLHYVIMREDTSLLELFPKEVNIWFTPNHEGKTCYDLLNDKYNYNTRMAYSLQPLKKMVEERALLNTLIEKPSHLNNFKL